MAGLAMQFFDLYTYHLFLDYELNFMVFVNYIFSYRINYRLFFIVYLFFRSTNFSAIHKYILNIYII